MSGRARSPAPILAAVLIALPLLITAGLATDFEVQPESITPTSPFSIALYNVTDGASLNITVTPEFLPPVSPSWCNFTNWKYGFALTKGNVTVHGENTNRVQLLVRTGKVYQMSQKTGTGDITVTFPLEFVPDVYYDFRILYEVHDAGKPVKLSLVQQGVKSGQDASASTPNIYGIDEGTLGIQVRQNGSLLGSDTVRIGPPITGTPQVPATTGTPAVTNGTVPTTPAAVTTGAPQPATTRTTVATVTTRPVTTRPPASPAATTPAPAPSPEPSAGGIPTVIIIYAAVIIIIAIIADYFLLKD